MTGIEQVLERLQWGPLDPNLLSIIPAGMNRFLPLHIKEKGTAEIAKVVNQRIVNLLQKGTSLNDILQKPDILYDENGFDIKAQNSHSVHIDISQLIQVTYGTATHALKDWKERHPNKSYLLASSGTLKADNPAREIMPKVSVSTDVSKRIVTQKEQESARAKRKDRIVQEMADYIVANDGPDGRKAAHPTKTRTSEEYVRAALAVVKKRKPELKWLKVSYFDGVNGAYTGKRKFRNAMERIDPVMKILIGKHGSIAKLIESVEQREFYDTEYAPLPGRPMTYSAKSAIEVAFENSFKHAIMYWLANNPDESIRKTYGESIRIWHFSQVPDGTWNGNEGKARAAQALDEAFGSIAKERGWRNSYDIVAGINTGSRQNDRLARYKKELSNGEFIEYSLQSLFTSKYFSSLSEMLGNYLAHASQGRQDEFLMDKRTYASFIKAASRFSPLPIGTTLDAVVQKDIISERTIEEHEVFIEMHNKGLKIDNVSNEKTGSISYLNSRRDEARSVFRALIRKVAYKGNLDLWQAVKATDINAAHDTVLMDTLIERKQAIQPVAFLSTTYHGNIGFALLDTLMHHQSEKVRRVCNWNNLAYQARH